LRVFILTSTVRLCLTLSKNLATDEFKIFWGGAQKSTLIGMESDRNIFLLNRRVASASCAAESGSLRLPFINDSCKLLKSGSESDAPGRIEIRTSMSIVISSASYKPTDNNRAKNITRTKKSQVVCWNIQKEFTRPIRIVPLSPRQAQVSLTPSLRRGVQETDGFNANCCNTSAAWRRHLPPG
jgi:hypothetical protein